MSQYTCQRCGKTFNAKCNLKSHLKKKKECDPNLSIVSRETLLKMIHNPAYKDIIPCDPATRLSFYKYMYCSDWSYEEICIDNPDSCRTYAFPMLPHM